MSKFLVVGAAIFVACRALAIDVPKVDQVWASVALLVASMAA